MFGSAADAEDVLQETWLRWAGVDLATVREQRAYLVRITTRQALTRLRALSRRKESYLGPWLPEPLLTAPDLAEDLELADSVSMAMLLVLETLAPTERAVFVLRDVFSEPARHPRTGRGPPRRQRRSQAEHPAAHRGSRQGGPRADGRTGQVGRRQGAAAGPGQRLPGTDPPPQRRDRHCHRGTHRRWPHHRALRRAQPREAVAHATGDHPCAAS
jgi:hypothetical protein